MRTEGTGTAMQAEERLRNVNDLADRWSVSSVNGPQVFRPLPDFPSPLEMDPLSVTASLAGILALATSLVKGIYSFSRSAKDFNNELTTIANEVTQLLGILHVLKSSVTRFTTSSSSANSGQTTADSSPVLTPSTPSDSDKDYELVSATRTAHHLSVQLVSEIEACQMTMTDITRLLSQSTPKRGQGISNVTKQFRWSLQKPDLQKMVHRLERHKAAFILILSSQGTY